MNNKQHSCEDYDGECESWKGYHGNDHDWTMEDFKREREDARAHDEYVAERHAYNFQL